MDIIDYLKEKITEELPAYIVEQKQNIINDQLRLYQWPPLTLEYAKRKKTQFGFAYPMLKATGELLDSFTIDVEEDSEGITFVVRNSVPYFEYANAQRNISDFSDEDLEQINTYVGIIVKNALENIEYE